MTDSGSWSSLAASGSGSPWPQAAHLTGRGQLLFSDPDYWSLKPEKVLGVRAGWARITGADRLPGPGDLEEAGVHLAPYRSLAAWYCRRAVDG